MAIQVVRARERGPSTAAQFAQAFGSAIGDVGGAYLKNRSEDLKSEKEEEKRKKENALVARLTGRDENELEDLQDEKIRQELVSSHFKSQNKDQSKELEKVSSLEGALERVQSMRDIRKRNNLGIGTSVRGIFSPEARKDQGEYETLGKSLIQYVSTIPIRNRQEFETLAHDLYDPSVSDDKAEGILNRLQEIIQDSLKPYEKLQGGESNNFPPYKNGKSKKRSLNSFILG